MCPAVCSVHTSEMMEASNGLLGGREEPDEKLHLTEVILRNKKHTIIFENWDVVFLIYHLPRLCLHTQTHTLWLNTPLLWRMYLLWWHLDSCLCFVLSFGTFRSLIIGYFSNGCCSSSCTEGDVQILALNIQHLRWLTEAACSCSFNYQLKSTFSKWSHFKAQMQWPVLFLWNDWVIIMIMVNKT